MPAVLKVCFGRSRPRFLLLVFVVCSVSCFITYSLVLLFSRTGEDRKWLTTDTNATESYLSVREVVHTLTQGRQLDTTSARGTTSHHNGVYISRNSGHSEEDVIYEQRLQHLQEACRVMTSTSRNTSAVQPAHVGALAKEAEKDFFVSPLHRLVYCAVNKVGCSFWKRVFRILNSVEPPKSLFLQSGTYTHYHNEHITFENKSSQWQRSQLSGSLKFIFVRDPFARAFSGYVDKIFLSFRKEHIDVHVAQESGNLVCRLIVPTFAEFIHNGLSIHGGLFWFQSDGHFTPIQTHCNPCSVPFDIVGKMESFQRDTEYILKKIGVRMSDIAGDPNTFDTRSDLNIMRDIVWRILRSPAWIKLSNYGRCMHAKHELLSRMWTAFQVRGLLSASVIYPLTPDQSTEASLNELMRAIEDGYEASGARGQRLQQRESAMMEAFRSVDLEDLKKLQAYLQADCDLFDYDCSLGRFFNAQNGSSLLPDYGFFKNW